MPLGSQTSERTSGHTCLGTQETALPQDVCDVSSGLEGDLFTSMNYAMKTYPKGRAR